jgi:hypothetical protein
MNRSDSHNTSEKETDVFQNDEKREALLTQYRLTRQDLRKKADRNDRRLIRGVILLGLILGYAFQTDTQILVVFIPLILGFLFTLGIQRLTEVDFLERQCLDIEEKLDFDELEEFDWTRRYGRLDPDNERKVEGDRIPRTDEFPFYVGYSMGAVTYILFFVYSLFLLADRPLFLIGVGFFYALFTTVLYFVWESEKKTRRELNNRSQHTPTNKK